MTSHDMVISHLCRDERLAGVVREVGDYRIIQVRNRYRALVEAVIAQQLSGSAAGSISARFRGLYPRFPRPRDVLETSDGALRDAGLSRMKILCIREISARMETGELRLRDIRRLPDEKVVAELTKIRGVGRWTAEMFLIFSLGRMDVLPVGDLGLRRGVETLYDIPDPAAEDIIEIAEKWRPFRSVAVWYIWKGQGGLNT